MSQGGSSALQTGKEVRGGLSVSQSVEGDYAGATSSGEMVSHTYHRRHRQARRLATHIIGDIVRRDDDTNQNGYTALRRFHVRHSGTLGVSPVKFGQRGALMGGYIPVHVKKAHHRAGRARR